MFGGNFAPRGYALCDGQLMPISSNTALFSLLGTNYGGNGTTTFGLPDFRGRVPVSSGQGPGLSAYQVGEETGTETVQLTSGQMPTHNHLINVNSQQTSDVANGNYPAAGGAYATALTSPGQLAAQAVATAGSSQAHPNLQPLLTVTFIIALQGIFPSRN
jgi:microcystin-dependent protein